MRITPIILAGGEGQRLFPISTPLRPKPFVPLAGGLSLLARTLARTANPCFDASIVIGHERHRFALLNHARDAGVALPRILLEADARNTALAVAAAVAATPDDEAMLAVLPADHFIGNETAWHEAAHTLASNVAGTTTLGLLGQALPEHNPNFGYMVAESGAGARKVQRFIEKPEAPPTLPEGAALLCNLGQFIGTRAAFAHALETHAPTIWQAAQSMVKHAHAVYEFTCLAPPDAVTPSSAFDRAVLEHATDLRAIACDIDWQDLGSKAAWNMHQCARPIAPPRVDRPWGHYTVLAYEGGRVKKHLVVYGGCRLSLQRHQKREEHWRVLTGTAHVHRDGEEHVLHEGDAITIPKGAWHRLENKDAALLEVAETQIGVPDETDIERREDDYGRV